ncbi:hypothetical protein LBMAG42_14100 [Deltaproteobacteria bacterium]|nr:hypothetical protein LBMAG42_14100 [Deltaproteobacteria bacterium]
MRLLLLLPLMIFAGCPDPSAPADDPTADPGMGGGGGAGGGEPGGAGGGAGGAPMTPPAIGSAKFDVKPGEGVKLSGTISYSGSKTGPIHIDFLSPGENGSFPGLLASMTIEKAGPWETEAPKGLGKVGVVGYVDVAGDGPNDGDPAARISGLVEVGSDAIAGLDLALSDTPDLGEFTPGKGDKGPPPGSPPADGAAAGAAPATDGAAPAGAPPAGGTPPADGTAPAGSAPPAAGAAPAAAAGAPAPAK